LPTLQFPVLISASRAADHNRSIANFHDLNR